MSITQWLRWLAPLALLIILGIIFRDELDFIEPAFQQLRTARALPTVLAAAASVVSILTMAEVMRLLMRAGAITPAFREAAALTLAANAWSTTVPGGPAISAVLHFQVQRRWGGSVALCGWYFVISGAISSMWLAIIGIAAVAAGATISAGTLVGSLVAVAAVGAAVYWACGHPHQLADIAGSVVRRGNRLLHRHPDRGVHTVTSTIEQLGTVHLSTGAFARVSAFSLANRLFDALTLAFAVWAVTGSIDSWSGVLLAYITAKIAGSAQVTPAGLGTVEAAIIAALVVTGMPAVDATGAAIIYRVTSFLLLAIVGWIVYLAHYARDGFAGPHQLAQRNAPAR